ncbi:hypothetical protein KC906_01215 [Candidatus Kaiserbacteria bacterium]|nr:hypothetical protein [Candidatus Kaiserbacteria bacterium]MCB9812374.1 hypothetical protein [Candidatus Nomurabacteria bacterium]
MNRSLAVFAAIALLLAIGAAFLVWDEPTADVVPVALEPTELITETDAPTSTKTRIGSSVEGRVIEAHTFGTGETNILLVGGIHGGYEWNSSALAYEMIDYLKKDSSMIPENITVHIIPNLNPDGLFAATGIEGKFAGSDITDYSMHTTGLGRMNAHEVDLNRNFDCNWSPESSWRSQPVSGGTVVFSEPEAIALRDYVALHPPAAAIFWHSMADNVYGSSCDGTLAPETKTLVDTYATASGYGAVPLFTAYAVTGAAEDWLAKLGVPAVTVELGSRTSSEWSKNMAGTAAVLQLYGGQ